MSHTLGVENKPVHHTGTIFLPHIHPTCASRPPANCLCQWLHTNGPSFLNPSPQHTKLLTQQEQIGWNKLIHRQFSKQWSTIQFDYISWLRTPPDGYSAQTWLQGIILIIRDHIHENRISWNEDQHGHDVQSWEDHKYAQEECEMSDLYRQRHLIEPCNWDLFYSTEAETFSHEMTSQGIQQWINTWKPIITSSIQ